jgi:O-antigen ligase
MPPPASSAPASQRGSGSRDIWGLWGIRVAVLSEAAFLPIALNPWVLSKEAVLVVGAVVGSRAAASGRLPRWSLLLVGTAAMLMLLSGLASAAPLVQLIGRFPRYEGLISLLVYFLAFWIGSRLLGADPGARRTTVFARTLAGVSIAIAAVSLGQLAGLSLGQQQFARPGALLGNATDQGIVGGMIACYLIVRVTREWRRTVPSARLGKKGGIAAPHDPFPWLELGGAVGSLVTLAVSASRGALLGTALALLVWVIVELARWRGFSRVVLGAVAAAILVFGVAAAVAPLVISRVLGASPLASATIQDRVEMAKQAVRLLSEHPILGVGPGGFVDQAPTVQGRAWFVLVGRESALDSPHSWLLQAAMAGGIPLLLLALLLAVLSIVVALRRWISAGSERLADHRVGAGLALVVYGIALLTHFTVASTTILAALMLGSIIAVPTVAVVPRSIARVRTALLGLAGLVLVVLAIAEVPLASGVAAARRGDIAGARTGFDTAAAIRPWDAELFSIAAQSTAADADERVSDAGPLAERYARAALALAPDSAQARLALSIALVSEGRLTAAEHQLEILRRRSPQDLIVLVRLADVASRQGDDARVRELLDTARAINPNEKSVLDAIRQLEK